MQLKVSSNQLGFVLVIFLGLGKPLLKKKNTTAAKCELEDLANFQKAKKKQPKTHRIARMSFCLGVLVSMVIGSMVVIVFYLLKFMGGINWGYNPLTPNL